MENKKSRIMLRAKSSPRTIKNYFTHLLELEKRNEPFPVNLEDVWPLVYTVKRNAVAALKNSELFIEGIDYILENEKKEVLLKIQQNPQSTKDGVFRKNAEKLSEESTEDFKDLGGRPVENYYLSLSCLEFFIARKVRPVFEVYRTVFKAFREGYFVPREQFMHLKECEKQFDGLVYHKLALLLEEKCLNHWELASEREETYNRENDIPYTGAPRIPHNPVKDRVIPITDDYRAELISHTFSYLLRLKHTTEDADLVKMMDDILRLLKLYTESFFLKRTVPDTHDHRMSIHNRCYNL